MYNSFDKLINNVNIVNVGKNKINSSMNTNYSSQKRKNLKQKSSSSELILFMKNKESNGISLYTHIQTLLDMFIFQNPVQPIKYFEYYSEQLKKYYNKSRPDPDLCFLNNIEKNICKKITDIYKDYKIKSEEKPFFEDKVSHLSYGEDTLGYEGENEFEGNFKSTVELNETIVQDLSKINHMFNKAGCGLTNDEVVLIGVTMDQMSRSEKFKNIRYWGKIFGLKRNYYVLECEWRNEELRYRLSILNNMNKNKYDYENIYENMEEEELEKDMLSEGSYEQIEEEKLSNPSLVEEQSTHKSESFCSFLRKEPTTDNSSGEIFGFGANKMSYFVTNKLSEEWIELPLLMPHHIIQSRYIKRYFTGDLESRVQSYPRFQGLEKHYLRANIARISAGTQVSPHDYFVFDNNSTKSNKWEKLNDFQSRVMSQKWVHDYVINTNYDPPPVYDLLKPNNWVHHTPLLSSKGVTNAWARLSENNDSSSIKSVSDEQIGNEDSTSFDQDDEYPDLFVPLSDDIYADKVPPWKFELTNPFDHKTTYVTIKSILWPGAFAVTHNKISDYTYYGWGHKWDVNSYQPKLLYNLYQLEYQNDTTGLTEMNDPTCRDELSFYEHIRKKKEDKKNRRYAAFTFQPVDEEEEEKILNQYNYD